MKNQIIEEMTTAALVAEYNTLTGKAIKKFSSRDAGERQVNAAREDAKISVAAQAEADVKVGYSAEEIAEFEATYGKLTAEEKTGMAKSPCSAHHGLNGACERCEATPSPKEQKVKAEPKPTFDYERDGCPSCGEKEDQTAAGLEGTVAGDQRNLCHHCHTQYVVATGKIYNAPKSSASRSEGIRESWNDAKVAEARATRHHVAVEGKGAFKSVRAAFMELGLPLNSHIKFRMELKAKGALEIVAGANIYKFSIVTAE